MSTANVKTIDEATRKIRNRKIRSSVIRYVILILVGIIMIYPLVWMVGATFKENSEIFSTINPIPTHPTLDGYIASVDDYNGMNIWKALLNTYSYVIPEVIFTVISCTLTAYGFGRFKFKGRNLLFSIMLAMLFLPQVVLNVPQYLMYTQWGWVNSPLYLPIIVPTLFATESYFVFMLVQFLRNIPKDLDEAAEIDGCNPMQILLKIIVPMLMPALVSVMLFKFMWSCNDFMGPLLYVRTPAKWPAVLFLRSFMDADTGFNWNMVLAVSLISIIPNITIFFLAQNQFVEGISAGGVKG
jgi:oligogalacturonide transport system permease protein